MVELIQVPHTLENESPSAQKAIIFRLRNNFCLSVACSKNTLSFLYNMYNFHVFLRFSCLKESWTVYCFNT